MKQLKKLGVKKLTLGSRLRELRKDKNLALWQVADQVGADKGNLSRLERDLIYNVKMETIKQLAELYNVSVDYLIYGSKDLNTDLPTNLKKFIDENNIDYLEVGLKAKEEGLSPEDAKKLIEVLSHQVK